MDSALNLIDRMRLNLSDDEKKSFARLVDLQKKSAGSLLSYPEYPAAAEADKKLKQLVRALQRAKRLVYDLGAWPDDLDNLPRIEITDVDFNQINLAREEHTNESGYATHKWPLLILNSFEEHYASILREMESQPKTRHPSQHSNRIYSILRRLDNRCREVGIRISSTENSQFYKLAAYVLPGTPDLRYSIRKVIEALNAEGRRG